MQLFSRVAKPDPPTVPADARCIKIDLDTPSKSTGRPAVAGLASPDAARADARDHAVRPNFAKWSAKHLKGVAEILDRSEGSGSMILSVKEAVIVSNLGWIVIADAKAMAMRGMRTKHNLADKQEGAVPHHRAEDAATYEMNVVLDLIGEDSVSWIREILLGVRTVTIKKTV